MAERAFTLPWRRIVLVTLSTRLVVVVSALGGHPAVWFYQQATELSELANNLLSGRGFSAPFGAATGPTAFMSPGYPAFVAGVFSIFGRNTQQSEAAIMLLQCAFACATVVAIVFTARRLFGERPAAWSGWLWALAPPLWFLPTIYWETSFSIMAMALLLLLAVRIRDGESTINWITLSVFSAATLLVNPAFLLVIALLTVWCVWSTRHTPNAGKWIAAVLFVVLSLPWPLRNRVVMHAWIPFRDNVGYELWQGNRPGADGFFDASLHPNNNDAELARWKALGELGYMQEKGRLARQAVRDDPRRFMRLTLTRCAGFWLATGRQSTPLLTLFATLTTSLALGGLWRVRSSASALLLAIPLVIFPLPYLITHPDFRFWCVLTPVLMMLVACLVTGGDAMPMRQSTADRRA